MVRACYVPLLDGDFAQREPGETITVLADEGAPVKTGILDENGTPLYRMPERVRIGFVGRG